MMALVEVVRAITSSDETIEAATTFATTCGKNAVQVKDQAGFIVNALLFPYLNNAAKLFDAGVATRDDIDAAMKGGCNFPMGPLELLDLVGLDTSLAILEALYAEFKDPNYAAGTRSCGAWSRAERLGRKTRDSASTSTSGNRRRLPPRATSAEGARSGRMNRMAPRDRPWLIRTYSGHSSARASNELYRTNLAKGQTGLSVAFDLPTQTGYDPDSPFGDAARSARSAFPWRTSARCARSSTASPSPR